MISLQEIGKFLATTYDIFGVALVPISLGLFFAAGYVVFSGKQGKVLGYELGRHGSKWSLAITLLIGSVSVLAIDSLLKGMYELFVPTTNIADLINFDNVANIDDSQSPLKTGLNLAGYYFYLVAMGLLIKAFISGSPKAIWYSLVGGLMTVSAATVMVAY